MVNLEPSLDRVAAPTIDRRPGLRNGIGIELGQLLDASRSHVTNSPMEGARKWER
jgi:hypothetical protein